MLLKNSALAGQLQGLFLIYQPATACTLGSSTLVVVDMQNAFVSRGGLLDLAGSGDATMLLGLPTWWGYLPMVPSFFLLGCAALFTAWLDFGGEAK